MTLNYIPHEDALAPRRDTASKDGAGNAVVADKHRKFGIEDCVFDEAPAPRRDTASKDGAGNAVVDCTKE